MASLDDLLMVLESISLSSDNEVYEQLGLFTVGGGTGTYILHSPVNTECEWALWGASAIAGTGLIAISSANPSILSMTTVAPTVGLSSGGMDNNAFEGIIIPVSATQNWIPFEYWQPLGRGANLNVAITMSAANIAYAIFSFRRRGVKNIPRLPRLKPHTHVPLSARGSRTFYQGVNEASPSRQPGTIIDVKPVEDTSTSKAHNAPGKNPMEALDRKVKRGLST